MSLLTESAEVGKLNQFLFFRVDTIEDLKRLLDQAADNPIKDRLDREVKKSLIGYGPNGERCCDFRAETFSVVNGLGVVQSETGADVDGLDHNEGFVEFLISLIWRSAFGWPSEMHALAVSASPNIHLVTEESL